VFDELIKNEVLTENSYKRGEERTVG